MEKQKSIVVIGGGFAGLTSAAILAKEGYRVKLLEKNEQVGGRARIWQNNGFTFDMGPSWYWMPEVFENFYQKFGYKTSDLYDLVRLDPGYRVYFSATEFMDIPSNMLELEDIFEKIEVGAGNQLKLFLKQAAYKYKVGMEDYVFRPSHTILEFMDFRLLTEIFKIQLLTSQGNHVREYFKHPKLIAILEFPVLFLGGTAQTIPALYSMMNFADLSLGTWYPMGGMHQIVKGMERICREQGVEILVNHEVKSFQIQGKQIKRIETNHGDFEADLIISSADYEHTDQTLIPEKYRHYTAKHWNTRVLSPSSLLFYIGLNEKLVGLKHHTLFFDESLENHAEEIFNTPKWPTKPLFYACCSSLTDPSVAPDGMENLFLLMPIAPGLEDTEALREKYFNILMERLEKITGQDIRKHVILKRSYALQDFIQDYHSFKGNAYGLANTLWQTAFLKPKMRAGKVKNLLYAGQLTVPGPGVPPSIISGEIVANEAMAFLRK